MRVAPFADDPNSDLGNGGVAPNEPFWAISVMQNLAKYVHTSKKWFEAYHFMPANSPIRLDTDAKLVGVAFAPDPVLGDIDTPNGRVEFLQMVGPHAARARLATRGSERRTSRAFDKHDAQG